MLVWWWYRVDKYLAQAVFSKSRYFVFYQRAADASQSDDDGTQAPKALRVVYGNRGSL